MLEFLKYSEKLCHLLFQRPIQLFAWLLQYGVGGTHDDFNQTSSNEIVPSCYISQKHS